MEESQYLFLLCFTIPVTFVAAFFGCRFLFAIIASYFHVWLQSEITVPRSGVSLSPVAALAEAELLTLGFRFIQITKSKYRGQPDYYYEFHYVHSNRVVFAVIFPIDITEEIKSQTHFLSVFEDRAMIITRYPFGSRIFNDRLISTFSRESISSAFEFHMQQVTAWELSRQPLRLYNRADIERLEYLYKIHHKRRDNASGYINVFSQGSLLLVTAIASVGVSFAAVNDDGPMIIWGFVIGISAFCLMLYLSVTGLNERMSFENRRRKSGKIKT